MSALFSVKSDLLRTRKPDRAGLAKEKCSVKEYQVLFVKGSNHFERTFLG